MLFNGAVEGRNWKLNVLGLELSSLHLEGVEVLDAVLVENEHFDPDDADPNLESLVFWVVEPQLFEVIFSDNLLGGVVQEVVDDGFEAVDQGPLHREKFCWDFYFPHQ